LTHKDRPKELASERLTAHAQPHTHDRTQVGEWDAKLYEVDGFEYITRHRNSKKKKKGHPFPQEDPFGNMDYEAYFSTSSKDMDKGTCFRTNAPTHQRTR